MVNDQISFFTEENENLYFLRFNLLNDYYMAVAESAELYTEDLVNLTSSDKLPLLINYLLAPFC